MNQQGIILIDDKRYQYTETYLCDKGYVFNSHATPSDLDFAIFPFMQKVDEAIYDDKFFANLKKSAIIFSGIRSTYLLEKCAEHGIKYHIMMDDAGIKIKNAVPTSEGVIAYLVHNLDCTIANSSILVIGYGVCGRDLAVRLNALGANVYALVRNREKECAAYADAVTPIYLNELSKANSENHAEPIFGVCRKVKFDAIVNTVPQSVLTDEMIERTGGTLMVDIASAPYGFNMEIVKKLNNKSALLAGIPGKCAAQTAGGILGEYIDYVLKLEAHPL